MEAEEALPREQYVYLAKLAEQAERYDEMAGVMEKMVRRTPSFGEFTVEERNLCSVAFKNVVGARRAAWRIVSSIEQKEERRRNEDHAALVRAYRACIEAELASICGWILGLLDSHLIPSAGSSESKVFYLKMKGDYHRYLAEFKVGEERKQAVQYTMAAYKAAQVIAFVHLAPTHPMRLGLGLAPNFSVFSDEILNSLGKACTKKEVRFFHISLALTFAMLCYLIFKSTEIGSSITKQWEPAETYVIFIVAIGALIALGIHSFSVM